MNTTAELPDYYAILQVHPSAEPEIIEAAYRRLMRKYHPDVLPDEMSSDPELLVKVRSINLAYDVLSDPVQRAAYDQALKQQFQPVESIDPEIETHILLVRCAQTKQRFRMLIGRRRGKSKIYRVLGFEPIDPPTPQLTAPHEVPQLPAPQVPSAPIRRLLNRLKPAQKEPAKHNLATPSFPSPDIINQMFDESASISFSQIDFGGHNCPACNGVHTRSNGLISNWCRCGSCKRIYCSGNVQSTAFGEFSHCPWCGRRSRITTTVKVGDTSNLPVKGEEGPLIRHKSRHLKDTDQKSLPEK